jgi:hypothetical protein
MSPERRKVVVAAAVEGDVEEELDRLVELPVELSVER